MDALRDDSIELSQALERQKVRNELKVYQGMCHGFIKLDRVVPTGAEAIKDAASWMNAC